MQLNVEKCDSVCKCAQGEYRRLLPQRALKRALHCVSLWTEMFFRSDALPQAASVSLWTKASDKYFKAQICTHNNSGMFTLPVKSAVLSHNYL